MTKLFQMIYDLFFSSEKTEVSTAQIQFDPIQDEEEERMRREYELESLDSEEAEQSDESEADEYYEAFDDDRDDFYEDDEDAYEPSDEDIRELELLNSENAPDDRWRYDNMGDNPLR